MAAALALAGIAKMPVPEEVKKRRLNDIIIRQRAHSAYRTKQFVGKTVEVLIEKESKKSAAHWSGRTPQNTVVVFEKDQYQPGDFVMVHIDDCTSATLIGTPLHYSKTQND